MLVVLTGLLLELDWSYVVLEPEYVKDAVGVSVLSDVQLLLEINVGNLEMGSVKVTPELNKLVRVNVGVVKVTSEVVKLGKLYVVSVEVTLGTVKLGKL